MTGSDAAVVVPSPSPGAGANTAARWWTDVLGHGVVYGFGTAVAFWVVWFCTDIPGVKVPQIVAAGLLVITALIGFFLGGRSAVLGVVRGGLMKAAGVGAVAGLVAGLMGLLRFGSRVVEQTATTANLDAAAEQIGELHADSIEMVIGFVLGFVVLGAIGGVMGGASRGGASTNIQAGESKTPDSESGAAQSWIRRWSPLARFGWVGAAAFLPLILIGGLVTSTRSGMAVPDWPGSYGANMFLFPQSLMSNPHIFLEHVHRLFGSLIGMTVLSLMVFVFVAERRAWVKWWAGIVFFGVCVQGLIGGLRVTENSLLLAVAHGVFGQVVFAFAVALAVYLSPFYKEAETSETQPDDRRRRVLATAAVHAIGFQLLMGASFRHLRHAESPGATHALWTHVLFSLAVVVLCLMAGFLARMRKGERPLDRTLRMGGAWMLGIVAFQFLLGWVALAFVMMSKTPLGVPLHDEVLATPNVNAGEAIVRTLHQTTGALLLATATVVLVISKRIAGRGVGSSEWSVVSSE
jgi:heme a synthase